MQVDADTIVRAMVRGAERNAKAGRGAQHPAPIHRRAGLEKVAVESALVVVIVIVGVTTKVQQQHSSLLGLAVSVVASKEKPANRAIP